MNITVCVKQIPDQSIPSELLPDSWRLRRADVNAVLDPGDEYAVEAALKLAEATGGEVTAVSMGPARADEALRKALSMGVHKAILVTDDALEGAAALVTARVLAAAIRKSGGTDVVITGTESTDGYTGVVPQALAELLGSSSLTFAKSVETGGEGITIHRQTDTGYQIVTAPLPVVVSVTAGANQPRYPSLKGIMGAKSKPLEHWSLADLGLDGEAVASSQRVFSVVAAPEKQAGELISDDGTAAGRIVEFLAQLKVI